MISKKTGKHKRTNRAKDFGRSRWKFRAKHSGQAVVNSGRHFGPSACRLQPSFRAGQGGNSNVDKDLQFGLLLQLRVHQWVCRCPSRFTVLFSSWRLNSLAWCAAESSQPENKIILVWYELLPCQFVVCIVWMCFQPGHVQYGISVALSCPVCFGQPMFRVRF